jgi:DNA-binding CsgD family transcriptional regulator
LHQLRCNGCGFTSSLGIQQHVGKNQFAFSGRRPQRGEPGLRRDQLVGQSFRVLYPSADEYERMGQRLTAILKTRGVYADDRIMKRVGGRLAGESFWCHVTGRALNPQAPHEAGIWSFEDLSARRPVTAELTPREREVAAHLMEGLTSKAIGRALGISHRTVEIYRARLMRKYQASTTAELVHKLLGG